MQIKLYSKGDWGWDEDGVWQGRGRGVGRGGGGHTMLVYEAIFCSDVAASTPY